MDFETCIDRSATKSSDFSLFEQSHHFASVQAVRQEELHRVFSLDYFRSNDDGKEVDDDGFAFAAPAKMLNGPWNWRSFTGFFCEPYLANTELEGGPPLPSIVELSDVLKRVAQVLLASRGLVDSAVCSSPDSVSRMASVAQFAVSLLTDAVPFGKANTNNMGALVASLATRLKGLGVHEMFFLPGGWHCPKTPGHYISYVIVRASSTTFDFIVCNSGEGLEYHPISHASYPKSKQRLCVALTGIPESRLLSGSFLFALLRMRDWSSSVNSPRLLYEYFLPILSEGAAATPAAMGQEELKRYHTPQMAGTCYLKGTLAALRYIFCAKGLTHAQIKTIFCLMRMSFFEMAVTALEAQQASSSALWLSGYHVLQIAAHQLVLKVINAVQGRHWLTFSAVEVVETLLERLRIALPKVLLGAPRVCHGHVPPLRGGSTLSLPSTKFPGFDLFGAEVSRAQYGTDATPEKLSNIPFEGFDKANAAFRLPDFFDASRSLPLLEGELDGSTVKLGSFVVRSHIERLVLESVGVPPSNSSAPNAFWTSVLVASDEQRQRAVHIFWSLARKYAGLWGWQPMSWETRCLCATVHAAIVVCCDALIACGVGPYTAAGKLHPCCSFLPVVNGKLRFFDDFALAPTPIIARTRHLLNEYVETHTNKHSKHGLWEKMTFSEERSSSVKLDEFTSSCDVSHILQAARDCHVTLPLKDGTFVAAMHGLVKQATPDDYLWPHVRDATILFLLSLTTMNLQPKGTRGASDVSWSVRFPEASSPRPIALITVFHHCHPRDVRTLGSLFPNEIRAAKSEAHVLLRSITPLSTSLSVMDTEALLSFTTAPLLRVSLTLTYLADRGLYRLDPKAESFLIQLFFESVPWTNDESTNASSTNVLANMDDSPRLRFGLLQWELQNYPSGVLAPLCKLVENVLAEERAALQHGVPVAPFLLWVRIFSLLWRHAQEHCSAAAQLAKLSSLMAQVQQSLDARLKACHQEFSKIDDRDGEHHPDDKVGNQGAPPSGENKVSAQQLLAVALLGHRALVAANNVVSGTPAHTR